MQESQEFSNTYELVKINMTWLKSLNKSDITSFNFFQKNGKMTLNDFRWLKNNYLWLKNNLESRKKAEKSLKVK